MGDTKNIVVLVAGGASGIGLATVQRYVKYGAKAVYLLDLPTSQGANIAKELGDRCINIPADLTKLEDVAACIQKIEKEVGQLDVVVNCAAISRPLSVADMTVTPEDIVKNYQEMNKVNVSGTYSVVCHAIRLMKNNQPDEDGGRGVIINFSSVQAHETLPANSAYAGGKGCIDSMTLGLARDLAHYGIRVVAIAPGLIDCGVAKQFPDSHEGYPSFKRNFVFPKRAGKAEEVARLVQDVAENKYINGTIIRIDAGFRYC